MSHHLWKTSSLIFLESSICIIQEIKPTKNQYKFKAFQFLLIFIILHPSINFFGMPGKQYFEQQFHPQSDVFSFHTLFQSATALDWQLVQLLPRAKLLRPKESTQPLSFPYPCRDPTSLVSMNLHIRWHNCPGDILSNLGCTIRDFVGYTFLLGYNICYRERWDLLCRNDLWKLK